MLNVPVDSAIHLTLLRIIITSFYLKVRDIRNDIMHSKSFQVDQSSLYQYIDRMILVLQDPKILVTDVAAQNAVIKLEKVTITLILFIHPNKLLLFSVITLVIVLHISFYIRV
jgi:hypothetical protein